MNITLRLPLSEIVRQRWRTKPHYVPTDVELVPFIAPRHFLCEWNCCSDGFAVFPMRDTRNKSTHAIALKTKSK